MSNAIARPTGESGRNEVRDTVKTLTLTVSRNIKRHLAERGMTRRQFAAELGLTGDQLKHRLSGTTPWFVNEVARAGEVLGLEHHGAALLNPAS